MPAFVNICTITPTRPSPPDSMLNSLLPRALVAVLVSLAGSRQPAQSPKRSNPRQYSDEHGAHALARISVGAKFDDSGSQPSHSASLIAQVTRPVLSTAMLTRTSPPSSAPPSQSRSAALPPFGPVCFFSFFGGEAASACFLPACGDRGVCYSRYSPCPCAYHPRLSEL